MVWTFYSWPSYCSGSSRIRPGLSLWLCIFRKISKSGPAQISTPIKKQFCTLSKLGYDLLFHGNGQYFGKKNFSFWYRAWWFYSTYFRIFREFRLCILVSNTYFFFADKEWWEIVKDLAILKPFELRCWFQQDGASAHSK